MQSCTGNSNSNNNSQEDEEEAEWQSTTYTYIPRAQAHPAEDGDKLTKVNIYIFILIQEVSRHLRSVYRRW